MPDTDMIIDFVEHDGGRRHANRKRVVGDCVTRSLAILTWDPGWDEGVHYRRCWKVLAAANSDDCCAPASIQWGTWNRVYERVFTRLGLQRHRSMHKPTFTEAHLTCEDCLIHIPGHMTCVRDFALMDRGDWRWTRRGTQRRAWSVWGLPTGGAAAVRARLLEMT